MSVLSSVLKPVLQPVLGSVFDASAGGGREPIDSVTFNGVPIQFNGENITYRSDV